jgi:hypothetical protein
MNEDTKKILDLLIKLAGVTEFDGAFTISKNEITGMKIVFSPNLPLSEFRSIKKVVDESRGDA